MDLPPVEEGRWTPLRCRAVVPCRRAKGDSVSGPDCHHEEPALTIAVGVGQIRGRDRVGKREGKPLRIDDSGERAPLLVDNRHPVLREVHRGVGVDDSAVERDCVAAPGAQVLLPEGEPVRCQRLVDADRRFVAVAGTTELPPIVWATYRSG